MKNKQVELVYWNPVFKPYTIGKKKWLPWKPRVNNFGDLLGPLIVRHLAGTLDRAPNSSARLATVGSIMHMCRSGDVVWGSGVNGKHLREVPPTDLDVRAVRGPRTARFLREHGVKVPEIYGDPGLLLPDVLPKEHMGRGRKRALLVLPNFQDESSFRGCPGFVSPRGSVISRVKQLLAADFVVSGSLHGLVLCDAYGIPVRGIASPTEPIFKYADYYEATDRPTFHLASSVEEALRLGPERPLEEWDKEALLASFPGDLFCRRKV